MKALGILLVVAVSAGRAYAAPPGYGKVAVVAKSGGDYTDPLAAMTSVSTWCGVPSSANPCLVQVMPGVYGFGAGTLQMVPFVDIEGSGENVTIFTGNRDSYTAGVVNAASNAWLRSVTIESTGGGAVATGVYSENASPRLTNVTIRASGGSSHTYGVNILGGAPVLDGVKIAASGPGSTGIGILNASATLVLTRSMVSATGTYDVIGLYNYNSPSAQVVLSSISATNGTRNTHAMYSFNSTSALMNVDVSAIASIGDPVAVYISGGAARTDGSQLTAPVALRVESITAYVGTTRIEGLLDRASGGALKCVGAYSGNYDPVSCL